MTKKKIAQCLFMVLICTNLFACGGIKETDGIKHIRIANPQATGDNVTLGYERFQSLVKEKSQGKIQIDLYSNAMLGSDRATTESVQGGTLDMASCSSPNFAGFLPEFMAFDLPYVTSPKYQKNLYAAIDKGKLGEYYRNVAREKGFEIIMFSEYGYRNFVTTKLPIQKLSDFKGVKLRTTNSPVEVAVAKAIGAVAMPVAWGETYTAMSQGAVDGEGNTWSLLYSAKHHELLKYGIDSAHNYSMHILVMNKGLFDSLSDEEREIIKSAAQEALDWQRSIAFVNEGKNKSIIKDSGVVIHDLSEDERAEFVKATKSVYDDFVGKIVPQEAVDMVMDTQHENFTP